MGELGVSVEVEQLTERSGEGRSNFEFARVTATLRNKKGVAIESDRVTVRFDARPHATGPPRCTRCSAPGGADDRHAPVPAEVVEGAQRAVTAAHHDHRAAPGRGLDVAARLGQLVEPRVRLRDRPEPAREPLRLGRADVAPAQRALPRPLEAVEGDGARGRRRHARVRRDRLGLGRHVESDEGLPARVRQRALTRVGRRAPNRPSCAMCCAGRSTSRTECGPRVLSVRCVALGATSCTVSTWRAGRASKAVSSSARLPFATWLSLSQFVVAQSAQRSISNRPMTAATCRANASASSFDAA